MTSRIVYMIVYDWFVYMIDIVCDIPSPSLKVKRQKILSSIIFFLNNTTMY